MKEATTPNESEVNPSATELQAPPSPASQGSLIHSNMVAIMKDAEAIKKSQKNNGQNFMFRGIDDIYNALHGIFAKHNVFITSKIKRINYDSAPTKNGGTQRICEVHVEYSYWAADGSCVTGEGVGESFDSGDKATGKALSYAQKSALIQSFLIETNEQNDPDYQTPELGGKPVGKQGYAKRGQSQAQQAAQAQPQPATQAELDAYWQLLDEANEIGLGYADPEAGITSETIAAYTAGIQEDMAKRRKELAEQSKARSNGNRSQGQAKAAQQTPEPEPAEEEAADPTEEAPEPTVKPVTEAQLRAVQAIAGRVFGRHERAVKIREMLNSREPEELTAPEASAFIDKLRSMLNEDGSPKDEAPLTKPKNANPIKAAKENKTRTMVQRVQMTIKELDLPNGKIDSPERKVRNEAIKKWLEENGLGTLEGSLNDLSDEQLGAIDTALKAKTLAWSYIDPNAPDEEPEADDE